VFKGMLHMWQSSYLYLCSCDHWSADHDLLQPVVLLVEVIFL